MCSSCVSPLEVLFFSSELQLGVEQQLLGAGLCDTDGQLSPITAQLYAAASLWANHNGPEETNGNEAGLPLASQERGVAESNSSGGKQTQSTVWSAVDYKKAFSELRSHLP